MSPGRMSRRHKRTENTAQSGRRIQCLVFGEFLDAECQDTGKPQKIIASHNRHSRGAANFKCFAGSG